MLLPATVAPVETGYQTCYRHPDQQAGVICQRCDRPICPQCMHQASVGFHCPECTKQGAQKVYQGVGSLQQRPIVTQVLVGINVAVFIIAIVAGGSGAASGGSSFHDAFALTAKLWERGDGLWSGPVPGSHMVGVGAGEWYRIVTSAFLHYGLIHILFNMYALWSLGPVLEQAAGKVRFGIVYAMSLAAGSLGALLLSPQVMTAGASGAIFGLRGALFMAHRSMGVPFKNSPLLWILVINLVITFAIPGISAGGHVGGLLGGALAGWLIFDVGRRPNVDQRAIVGGGIAIIVALLGIAIAYSTSYQPTF